MPYEIRDRLSRRVVYSRPTCQAAIDVAVKGLARLPDVPKEPQAAWLHLHDKLGYRAVEVKVQNTRPTSAPSEPFVYLG